MSYTTEELLEASLFIEQRRKERMTTTMSDKVVLETNVWAEIALKWPDGKNLSNEYGESVMFSTVDNRVLFVPVPAAEKVRALNLHPGERLNIRKAEVRNGGGKSKIEWQVQRIDPPAGEQANGTLVVKKETAPVSAGAAPATGPTQPLTPTCNANGSKESPYEHTGRAALLRDTTNMLVDVLAACKGYSARYNGLLSADDVRSCLLSAYIALSKEPRQ